MLLVEPFCPGWEPLGPSWVGAKEKGLRSKILGSWAWDRWWEVILLICCLGLGSFGSFSCCVAVSVKDDGIENRRLFFIFFQTFLLLRAAFSSVQLLIISNSATPWMSSTPGFPVHHQLLELAQTHFHWVSDAIQPSHPLSSLSPPTLNLSLHQGLSQRVSSLDFLMRQFFASGGQSTEFELQHQSFWWTPGLISFRMDWFDLLEVQGTLKSLQHHSSKVIILWRSGLFYCPALTSIHDYWKNHSFDYTDLCRQNNVSAFQHTA